jgi:hypothetical protein
MERLSMAEKFTRWDAVDTLENEEEPKDRRGRHSLRTTRQVRAKAGSASLT